MAITTNSIYITLLISMTTAHISSPDDFSGFVKHYPYKPGHKPDVLRANIGSAQCNKRYKDTSTRPDVFESSL